MDFLLSSDVANEQIILSAATQSLNHYGLFANLSVEDFLKPEHRTAARALLDIGEPCGVELLHSFCKKLDSSIPTIEDLQELYSKKLPPIKEFQKHIELLKSDTRRRQIEDRLLPQLLENLATKSKPISEISAIAAQIKEVADSGAGKIFFLNTEELLKQYEKSLSAGNFFSCGFGKINDSLVRGFAPGEVTIIAGRPAMGKSTWAVESAIRLSRKKVTTLFFSLEMDPLAIVNRMISRISGIHLSRLTKARQGLTQTEHRKIWDAETRLRKNKFLFLCGKSASLQFISEQIRRFKIKYEVDYLVVFVDLFGKIQDLRSSYLAQSTEKCLNRIQSMAQELQVHFVLTAQINRDAEKGKSVWDYRPKLKNIKNAGAFEEVGDLILLLFRAKYYDNRIRDDVLEVNIAKQRNGEAGTTHRFLFQGETSRIIDTDITDLRE